MVKLNDTDISLSCVLSTSAGKRTRDSALSSIPNLILRGSQVETGTTHPIVWLAESDKRWNVSGMAEVLEPLGIMQADLLSNPGQAIVRIAKIFSNQKTAQKAAQGTVRHWQKVCDGLLALPIEDQVIKPAQVLRDIVNDRKDKATYRNTHVLPGLYVGHCTCCNTHRMHTTMQLLTTVPVISKGESKLMSKLESMLDTRGNNFSIMSSMIMDLMKDNRNAGVMFLLQGDSPQAIIVPLLTERRHDGKFTWDMTFACANCLHNLDNAQSLVSSAYATKMTTDLYYALFRDFGIQGAREMVKYGKTELDEIRSNRDKAKRHLDNVLTSGKNERGKGSTTSVGHATSGKMFDVNTDALCRELLDKGLGRYVHKGRSKTQRHKLNKAGTDFGVKALKNLLEVQEASEKFVTVDSENLFSGVGSDE